MENEKYTIDQLIKIFTRHAKQYDLEDYERRVKWKEINDEEYPHEYFNIAKAFLCILGKIKSN